ncbi:MAG: metallophosphoesterase [Oscillospiraceae bacterium]|jgi:hypothetical protein|nr:metallophosphoesterase [Oscillospiraceae bacterium]
MQLRKLITRLAGLSALLALVSALAVPAAALSSEIKPPEDDGAFSFLYFGDIQVTQNAEYDFAKWGELAESAARRNPGAAFALQGGDIVESGIDRAQWDAFFENADSSLGDMPFFPTNGNHESNFLSGKPELYLEMFELPENGPDGFTEEFYSFDYGPAHIAVLNSWVFSGEQKLTDEDLDAIDKWVARDLADSDAKWKIVLTHLPIYAVHKDGTADKAREHWAPIFEKYGVTLLLVGHQHVYSRLAPLTDGVPDYIDGVTQIMGNSGQKFYSSADETLAERTIYNVAAYQLARVDGDTLTVQTFDIDGNELEFAELRPRESKPLTRGEFIAEYYADGVLRGYGAGDLGLDDVITNEQIATLLWRGAGEPRLDMPPPPPSHTETPSEWAADAWQWAVASGIFGEAAAPLDTPARGAVITTLKAFAESI